MTDSQVIENKSAAGCKALIRDPELMLVISAWARLSEPIRKKISLIAQGRKEIVKLVWTTKGYERIITGVQQEGETGADKISPGRP